MRRDSGGEGRLWIIKVGFRTLPTAVLLPFLPRLQLFNDAIRLAVAYKESSQDFMDEVLQELEVSQAQFLVR